MHRLIQPFVRLFLVLFIAGSAAAANVAPTGQAVSGEVLVKIRAGASQADISNLQRIADADQSERLANLGSGALWRLHSRSKNTEALAAALAHNPNVEYAEPNYVVGLIGLPNDASFGQLWGLKNTGQSVGGGTGTPGADIDAESAWNVTTGSAAIVIGVVDTGVDYNHPDLAANVWSNPGGKGNALCAAGTHGFDAITKTCNPMDNNDHGTHVSGTIGAVGNNSIGVAGVNWTTSIMGLKFLGADGYGTIANAIVAIDFAVQAKIDGVNLRVLSNSWGGGGFSRAMLDVINKANEHDILFVAAAGNSSYNNDATPHYPSSYATPNMIAVAATDNRDALAWFSNYGAQSVHLGAPGVSILSTIRGTLYSSFNGTSMATPHVAGVAGLVLAQTPARTTAEVKNLILTNTDPISSLAGKTVTGGRLNAARALGAPVPPDYSLGINPTSRVVVQGASTTFAVTVNPVGGFNSAVALSVTGLPPGATASFNPSSTTTNSTLTVTTVNPTPNFTYSLNISGVGGGITRTVNATVLVATTPPIVACPTLTYHSSYYTGSPAGIATADFDRDGKLDLAVANVTQNRVSVLLGAGGASFGLPNHNTVGVAPLSVAAGDFNGDGRPDLAVANSGSGNVSVLLGLGNGTFQVAVNYEAGTSPFAVAVGDFDADGNLDLAVANNGSSNVSILLGAGDGTFGAAANYGAASGPFWVAVGDFDRDGAADLAVADFNAGKVSVLLGNGDGTFQTTLDYAAGSGPAGVAAGDFDGDGMLDLAVANHNSNNVSVLLGNGNGTFDAAVHYGVGSAPYFVAAGDLNGDGKLDLATANSVSMNVSVLLGTGAGTFLDATHYPTSSFSSSSPNQLVLGDFNDDAKADVAVADLSAQNVVVMTNRGTCSQNCASFAAAVDYAAGTTSSKVDRGDFNRDGRPDLAVSNSGSANLSILLGASNGTFAAGVTLSANNTPVGVTAGDFNSDGSLDLAVANQGSNNLSIFSGNGDGTFQTKVDYNTGTGPYSVAAGDFDRDGNLDLAVANKDSSNVSILIGNGDATFDAAVHYGAGTTPETITTADFNRDGRLDLAVANSGSGNVSILSGNANGTFQAATSISAGSAPSSVVAVDLNGDGKADLAVANRGSHDVSVRLGNGNGTFLNAVQYGAGTNPSGIIAGDFNDDGILDLAVSNQGSNNVSILAGAGGGTFAAAVNRGAGTLAASIIAGDFNRDGKLDLAVPNSGAATVSIIINTCPAPDLAITKSHTGNFTQGDTGRTYTITVTNVGSAATAGPVTVVDTLPAGLTATAMSGTGWTCTLATRTCTRSDVLASGASYPSITLTVNVASGAPASVTNQATVSGGGQLNRANDTASDPTSIVQITDLIVTKTHAGNFTQGDTGRTYKIVARNAGGLATNGTVTVTDTLPAGLTATAISGTGWTCTLGTLSCTRSDVLAGGANYPAITVTVNVATNAAASVINTASVSGGSQSNTANDTALDPTVIWTTQSCGVWASPVVSTATYGINSAVVRDFNNDGKADLATVNGSYYKVSIRLGNGNGTFASEVDYPVGDNPTFILAADFDQNGKIDLVVANYYGSSISMLLGNGDGTFAAANHTVNFYYTRSLAAADFNSDGRIDLAAVAGSNYNQIHILIGKGDGTFQPAIQQNAASYPTSIAAADFNNDGKSDLVTTHDSSGVWVMLGNGDGTFQTGTQYANNLYYHSVAVADFNRDGNTDLVVTNSSYSVVVVLLGTGAGSFSTPTTYNVSNAGPAAVDDLNGDGKIDIVVGSGSFSNGVKVLFGNGNGTFQAEVHQPLTGYADRVAIGDFNGDGRPDLVVTAYSSYEIRVLLGGCPDISITKTHIGNFKAGQSNATYTLTVSNAGTASTRGTITVTDALPAGMTATGMSGVGWNCTTANATCTRSDALAGGASYPAITLAVNVSNSIPPRVTNVATVSGGADSNSANNTANDPTLILRIVGDFNGDRVSDYVIFRAGTFVAYDYNTHAQLWSIPTGITDGIPMPMDYDGDGRTELSVYKPGRAWHFYNDDGTYLKGIWIGVAGDIPVPADYDGDGKEDVVVYRNGTWVGYDFNSGASLWTVNTGVVPDAVPLPMDYDGDGTADFTVYRAGRAWHFYNDNGSYNRGFWIGVAGDIPVPGDYDGDGKEEPVVYRTTNSWNFYDLNTGTLSRTVTTGVSSSNGDPLQPSPLDYDGDGAVDFTVYAGGPWYTFQDNGPLRGAVWAGGVPGDLAISRREHWKPTP